VFDCFQRCFNSAFKFNLRRYNKDILEHVVYDFGDNEMMELLRPSIEVRRCRLTGSKPMFKAHMVAALETII